MNIPVTDTSYEAYRRRLDAMLKEINQGIDWNGTDKTKFQDKLIQLTSYSFRDRVNSLGDDGVNDEYLATIGFLKNKIKELDDNTEKKATILKEVHDYTYTDDSTAKVLSKYVADTEVKYASIEDIEQLKALLDEVVAKQNDYEAWRDAHPLQDWLDTDPKVKTIFDSLNALSYNFNLTKGNIEGKIEALEKAKEEAEKKAKAIKALQDALANAKETKKRLDLFKYTIEDYVLPSYDAYTTKINLYKEHENQYVGLDTLVSELINDADNSEYAGDEAVSTVSEQAKALLADIKVKENEYKENMKETSDRQTLYNVTHTTMDAINDIKESLKTGLGLVDIDENTDISAVANKIHAGNYISIKVRLDQAKDKIDGVIRSLDTIKFPVLKESIPEQREFTKVSSTVTTTQKLIRQLIKATEVYATARIEAYDNFNTKIIGMENVFEAKTQELENRKSKPIATRLVGIDEFKIPALIANDHILKPEDATLAEYSKYQGHVWEDFKPYSFVDLLAEYTKVYTDYQANLSKFITEQKQIADARIKALAMYQKEAEKYLNEDTKDGNEDVITSTNNKEYREHIDAINDEYTRYAGVAIPAIPEGYEKDSEFLAYLAQMHTRSAVIAATLKKISADKKVFNKMDEIAILLESGEIYKDQAMAIIEKSKPYIPIEELGERLNTLSLDNAKLSDILNRIKNVTLDENKSIFVGQFNSYKESTMEKLKTECLVPITDLINEINGKIVEKNSKLAAYNTFYKDALADLNSLGLINPDPTSTTTYINYAPISKLSTVDQINSYVLALNEVKDKINIVDLDLNSTLSGYYIYRNVPEFKEVFGLINSLKEILKTLLAKTTDQYDVIKINKDASDRKEVDKAEEKTNSDNVVSILSSINKRVDAIAASIENPAIDNSKSILENYNHLKELKEVTIPKAKDYVNKQKEDADKAYSDYTNSITPNAPTTEASEAYDVLVNRHIPEVLAELDKKIQAVVTVIGQGEDSLDTKKSSVDDFKKKYEDLSKEIDKAVVDKTPEEIYELANTDLELLTTRCNAMLEKIKSALEEEIPEALKGDKDIKAARDVIINEQTRLNNTLALLAGNKVRIDVTAKVGTLVKNVNDISFDAADVLAKQYDADMTTEDLKTSKSELDAVLNKLADVSGELPAYKEDYANIADLEGTNLSDSIKDSNILAGMKDVLNVYDKTRSDRDKLLSKLMDKANTLKSLLDKDAKKVGSDYDTWRAGIVEKTNTINETANEGRGDE